MFLRIKATDKTYERQELLTEDVYINLDNVHEIRCSTQYFDLNSKCENFIYVSVVEAKGRDVCYVIRIDGVQYTFLDKNEHDAVLVQI